MAGYTLVLVLPCGAETVMSSGEYYDSREGAIEDAARIERALRADGFNVRVMPRQI